MDKRFDFTGDRLRRLRPTDGRRVYFYDAAVRGLALEVTPSGAKSFRLYRKFKGRPVKITLGPLDPELPESRELPAGAEPLDLLGNHPSLNVRMARKLAVAVLAELDTGVNPAAALARKGMTLAELFRRYTGHLDAEGKKTVLAIRWHFERYLGELPDQPRNKHGAERTKAPGGVNWARRGLGEITYADVARLRLDLAEKVGRTTANHVIELLRAAYNFAKKNRLYSGENPADGLDKFATTSRERFLQSDEVQRFFTALDADPDGNFRDFVRLALYTGARRGNVLRMRWEGVNLDGARWTIAGELMKNGEPLTIPLVKEALEILRRRQSGAKVNPWVFPGRTPAGHMGPQRLAWARLLKAAELNDFRLHDLRRSLGSWMASSGASTVVTMRALGHKTINAALIYQRLAADPVRDAMQAAVTAMAETAKGKAGRVVTMPKGRKVRGGRR